MQDDCHLALCSYMCVSLSEYMGTCVCMCVCTHGRGGNADNPDMLKGAEGNKACSALAKALPACSLLKLLHLVGEGQGKART